MRLLCHVVARNEADRYWHSWLDWHHSIFDEIHVFDDQSTDDTVKMAVDAGCKVSSAPEGLTFLDHEGKFRQQAWKSFEESCSPTVEDWVFCIDADEFFVTTDDERNVLWRSCEWATQARRGAFLVPIPEVFHVEQAEDGELTNPLVRTDGFWAKIRGTRLFSYRPAGVFSDKAMGSGSEPTYVLSSSRSVLQGAWLVHYGYANPLDIQTKYERYSTMAHGHDNSHIESIVKQPTLVTWDGPEIPVFRGHRPPPGPGDTIDVPVTPPEGRVLTPNVTVFDQDR